VIGRSAILGKPVGLLLLGRDATVTFCHSKTVHLARVAASADVVVAAVGRPRFVKGEWIKPGAVVVDAGYNPGNVGDVDFRSGLGASEPHHTCPRRRRAYDHRHLVGADSAGGFRAQHRVAGAHALARR
jgi:5,10-methylene-tetrahydrofolate dehydrogenase/methenyl tetrahydrofolate cyclohydrolase